MTDHSPDRPASSTRPSATRSIAGLGALLAVGWALVAAEAALPPPPLSPHLLPAWIEDRGTAAAVASVLRYLSLIAVAYLTVLTLAALASRRHPRARPLTRRPLLGRRVVEHVLGVGVATGIGVALVPTSALAGPVTTVPIGAPTSEPADPAERALMVPIRDGTTPSSTSPEEPPGPPIERVGDGIAQDAADPSEDTVTMISIDGDGPDQPTATVAPTPTGAPTSAAPPLEAPTPDETQPPGDEEATDGSRPTPEAMAAPGEPSTWRVVLGDHLWAIAAETLADADLPRDDGAVLAYWARLVDTNRDRLVDPGNPDLLYPGQVLALPSVSVG